MRILIIIITVLFTMVSCTVNPLKDPEYITKSHIVINKTEAINDGYTVYLLATNKGYTSNITFGEYSCVQIGDTIIYTINTEYNQVIKRDFKCK